MLYTKTYHGVTEELELDFYTSLMRDILFECRYCDEGVEIPRYIYEHREEFMEKILASLEHADRELLEQWYKEERNYEKMLELKKTGIEELNWQEKDCIDQIYCLANEETMYILEHGVFKNFPMEDRLQNENKIIELRNQVLEEMSAYEAGKEWEFRYLNEILKKYPDLMELQIDSQVLVADLGFSVRTYNCLRRAGIVTVGQMMELNEEKIAEIRHLRGKYMRELLEKQSLLRICRGFYHVDKSIFEFSFPAALIKILLDNGYFFWSDMKHHLLEIEKLVDDACLEVLRETFEQFRQEKEIEKINNNETVTLKFERVMPEKSFWYSPYRTVEDFIKG